MRNIVDRLKRKVRGVNFARQEAVDAEAVNVELREHVIGVLRRGGALLVGPAVDFDRRAFGLGHAGCGLAGRQGFS